MRKLPLLMVAIALFGAVRPASAQSSAGRWSLGLYGGANYWVTDYDKLKVGPGFEAGARYNLQEYFSLGFLGGYELLKTEQRRDLGPSVFHGYMQANAIPLSLVGYFRLMSRKSFSPYFFIGGGALVYRRGESGGVYPVDGKWLVSYAIPAGLGFESFVTNNLAIDVKAEFVDHGDWIDARKVKTVNGYASLKAGFNYYFGSSDADDDDKDGLTNGEERRYGTDPENPDTDGDGLLDGEEVKRYRTNPLRPDTDGDGLTDGEEVLKYKTDPLKFDTDGDGLSDGDEVFKYKTDPLRVDTDGDGLSDGDEVIKYKTDPLRVDTDGDGLTDWEEVMIYHTDPNNPDTDGDGLTDGDEVKKYHTDPLKADTDGGGVDDGTEVKRGTNPLDPRDDIVMVLEKGKSLVMEGVTFETGSANLARESETTLERAYVALVANPSVRIEIAGYTDNVGGVQSNDRLSQRRADAVSSWLIKRGIGATRVTSTGRGSRDPIAPNTTPQGRAKNRRIEFHVR